MSTQAIQTQKLWWAGPLTVVAAILGVLVVRIIAVALIPPPYLPGLGWIMPIVLTTILCTGGVLVYAVVARFAKHPLRTYLIISSIFLLVSFVPDVLVAYAPMPGAGWPSSIAEMTMHVVAGFITVFMLIKLTASEGK
jgi:hypothetical protein